MSHDSRIIWPLVHRLPIWWRFSQKITSWVKEIQSGNISTWMHGANKINLQTPANCMEAAWLFATLRFLCLVILNHFAHFRMIFAWFLPHTQRLRLLEAWLDQTCPWWIEFHKTHKRGMTDMTIEKDDWQVTISQQTWGIAMVWIFGDKMVLHMSGTSPFVPGGRLSTSDSARLGAFAPCFQALWFFSRFWSGHMDRCVCLKWDSVDLVHSCFSSTLGLVFVNYLHGSADRLRMSSPCPGHFAVMRSCFGGTS